MKSSLGTGGWDWLDNKRRASLGQDLSLRVDVLFLPVVDDVLLLYDLQRERDVLVLHLHLQMEATNWDITANTRSLVMAMKSAWRSHQLHSPKAAHPERRDDLQVVEGPGRGEGWHHLLQAEHVRWQRLTLVAWHGLFPVRGREQPD